MTDKEVPTITRGQRLRIALEFRNMTSADLARQLKVSRHTVENWSTGHHEPSHANMVHISDLLNVKLEWLIDGTT